MDGPDARAFSDGALPLSRGTERASLAAAPLPPSALAGGPALAEARFLPGLCLGKDGEPTLLDAFAPVGTDLPPRLRRWFHLLRGPARPRYPSK